MAIGYFDFDAIIGRLVDDFNEAFAPMGLQMAFTGPVRPRRSFWQTLKDEIAARPRVF